MNTDWNSSFDKSSFAKSSVKICFDSISGLHQTIPSNDQGHDATGGKFSKEETFGGEREERKGKGKEERRNQTAEGDEKKRNHGQAEQAKENCG